MNIDKDTLDFILYFGGGSGALVVVALMIRKLWLIFRDSYSEAKQTVSEATLIDNLVDDVQRTREELEHIKTIHQQELDSYRKEIVELKEFYIKEKNELLEKVDYLANKVQDLERRNYSMRASALDAYAYVTLNNYDYEGVDDLKSKLMEVILKADEKKKSE